jgi:hypothetical protein
MGCFYLNVLGVSAGLHSVPCKWRLAVCWLFPLFRRQVVVHGFDLLVVSPGAMQPEFRAALHSHRVCFCSDLALLFRKLNCYFLLASCWSLLLFRLRCDGGFWPRSWSSVSRLWLPPPTLLFCLSPSCLHFNLFYLSSVTCYSLRFKI